MALWGAGARRKNDIKPGEANDREQGERLMQENCVVAPKKELPS